MKTNINPHFGIVGMLVLISFICAGIYGWVENIIKLVHIADLPITGMFILRVVGIFLAPLGALLGYM